MEASAGLLAFPGTITRNLRSLRRLTHSLERIAWRMVMALDRDEAFRLFSEWNQNEGLVKHGLAVETAVRAYARKFGEDENKWGIAGLLHDIDYERHPTIEEHGKVGADLLRQHDYPEEVVHAVQAH